jgi:hypothetical protein
MAVSVHQNSSASVGRGKTTLILATLIVAVSLPLSVYAALNTVSLNPKAAGSGSTGTSVNQPPTLSSPIGNTINCKIHQDCTAAFKGTSPNENDNMNLEINFLPAGLHQNTCQSNSLPSQTSLNCSFSGQPERTGEFKLLVSLTDQGGLSDQQIISLNVH